MERLLHDKGLLATRTVAASLGGSNDRGRGLSPRGRELLREAVERNDVELIDEPTLDASIARRVEILDSEAQPEGIRAYVNLGGGAASTGTSQNIKILKPGINRVLKPYNFTLRGALHHYGLRRVPIIHVLQIQDIAETHGLPVAPETVPPVGEGLIFYRESYDLRITIPVLVIYLVLCFGVLRARHRAARVAREISSAPRAAAAAPPDGLRERSGG
jgi:hypothetical protein